MKDECNPVGQWKETKQLWILLEDVSLCLQVQKQSSCSFSGRENKNTNLYNAPHLPQMSVLLLRYRVRTSISYMSLIHIDTQLESSSSGSRGVPLNWNWSPFWCFLCPLDQLQTHKHQGERSCVFTYEAGLCLYLQFVSHQWSNF